MAAVRKDRGRAKRVGAERSIAKRASAERSEHALLAQVRAAVDSLGRGRGVVVGIGDDCAVVRGSARTVLTTDSTIEGVHFRSGWLTPRELGVRAFRAAVSDIAAMGARPRYVLLSLEVPGSAAGFGSREALALVRAVAAAAREAGAALVGGNVSGADRVGVTVTAIGELARKPVLRKGARAGDFVFVTGTLGGSAAGCRALSARKSATVAPSMTAAYRRPPLRLDFGAGLADRGIASSMIDVSDGLLQDLGHVAEASGVAIRVDASMVPVHRSARRASAAGSKLAPGLELALAGGEDYELAFTARESACEAIETLSRRCKVPVTVIGIVQRGRSEVTDLVGQPFGIAAKGFDHLRPKRAKANVRARRRSAPDRESRR